MEKDTGHPHEIWRSCIVLIEVSCFSEHLLFTEHALSRISYLCHTQQILRMMSQTSFDLMDNWL